MSTQFMISKSGGGKCPVEFNRISIGESSEIKPPSKFKGYTYSHIYSHQACYYLKIDFRNLAAYNTGEGEFYVEIGGAKVVSNTTYTRAPRSRVHFDYFLTDVSGDVVIYAKSTADENVMTVTGYEVGY